MDEMIVHMIGYFLLGNSLVLVVGFKPTMKNLVIAALISAGAILTAWI